MPGLAPAVGPAGRTRGDGPRLASAPPAKAAPAIDPAPLAEPELEFKLLRNAAISGHDIRRAKGVRAADCESQCRREPQCSAYLYDKWNRWCFLKSGLSEATIDPKYDLGLKPGLGGAYPSVQRSSRPREVSFYRNKQFPGAGAFYQARDFRASGRSCLSVRSCVAFTFDRRAGWPAPCKIMGETGEYFSKAGVHSGVVRQTP